MSLTGTDVKKGHEVQHPKYLELIIIVLKKLHLQEMHRSGKQALE